MNNIIPFPVSGNLSSYNGVPDNDEYREKLKWVLAELRVIKEDIRTERLNSSSTQKSSLDPNPVPETRQQQRDRIKHRVDVLAKVTKRRRADFIHQCLKGIIEMIDADPVDRKVPTIVREVEIYGGPRRAAEWRIKDVLPPANLNPIHETSKERRERIRRRVDELAASVRMPRSQLVQMILQNFVDLVDAAPSSRNPAKIMATVEWLAVDRSGWYSPEQGLKEVRK